MKSTNTPRIRVSRMVLGVTMVLALVVVRGARADEHEHERAHGQEHQHLVTDWSHRYLVYSNPTTLMRRFELSTHHRYVQQWMRRNAERRHDRDEWRWHRAPENPNLIQGDWSMNMGAGATVGADNYPAKFSFNTATANCVTPAPPGGQQPDFVVYNTSLAGSGTQANIVAFTNLYTSCMGGTPQTYWAYNTGAGAAVTSPVLSFDGTQVAFIENTAGAATLVILRWKAGTGTLTAPVAPSSVGCTALTAPCQTRITFSTANSDTTPLDTFSSPFYDYRNDVLYAGDDMGFLHKFTGVFLGSPAEVLSPGPSTLWPANLTTGFGHLNSPVFVDSVNEVLITASDGELYVVDSAKGGAGSNAIDPKLANPGFEDGPLVDVTTGKVYLFARASSEFIDSNAVFGFHGVPNVPSVFELDLPATPDAIHFAPYIQVVVTDSTTIPASAMFNGAFDDAYYGSTGASGNLYVCGTTGTVNAIWGIPIASNVVGTPFLGPTLSTANVGCSSITEFNNQNTNIDRIFLSVAGSAVTGGNIHCPSNTTGCVMSFRVDSTLSSSTATSATAPVTGGTSGIVIDNFAAAGGTAQVYFTPLADQACTTSGGTGGCAIQASQSGLN